jgi:hypothetical protein
MSTTEITLEEADAIARKIGEGFYPHPSDRRKFFRLATMGGEMKRFDFDCGPDTEYHPELHVAVHPWMLPQGYTPQGYWSALKTNLAAK